MFDRSPARVHTDRCSCFQLEIQRQQLLQERQQFHMEQLRAAEYRARQTAASQLSAEAKQQMGVPGAVAGGAGMGGVGVAGAPAPAAAGPSSAPAPPPQQQQQQQPGVPQAQTAPAQPPPPEGQSVCV